MKPPIPSDAWHSVHGNLTHMNTHKGTLTGTHKQIHPQVGDGCNTTVQYRPLGYSTALFPVGKLCYDTVSDNV